MLLTNFIILYQVIYSHWNSDFYIENNIAATKRLNPATIEVFAPQCHLYLRVMHNLRESSSFMS